jgi:hypothetical protein
MLVNQFKTLECKNENSFDLLFEKLDSIEKKISDNDNKIVNEIKKSCDNNQLYSAVLKNNKQNKPDPVVVLKPKNKQKKRFEAKNEIRSVIDPENVPVTGMINGANGDIIIQCKNVEATKMVEQEINEHFGEDFETIIPAVKKPRIKIVGIYDDDKKYDENKFYVEKCCMTV